MTSVTCPPRCAVKLVDAALMEKSEGAAEVKVAVGDSSPIITMLQMPMPEQGPLQPENVDPGAGEAVKVTIVPRAKLAEQDPGQFMPAGLPTTVPLPLPAKLTERVKLVGVAPPSITVTFPLAEFAM